jgi:hypothetical protein
MVGLHPYEPDAQTVIDDLLVRYVQSAGVPVHQAVASNNLRAW